MIEPIVFRVYGRAKAKARPRVTRSGHAFTPRTTMLAEAHVRDAYLRVFPTRKPLKCPLYMKITFYRVPPVSWPKWQREAANDGRYWDAGRPDIDNLIKTITDGLNGCAYIDDGQIVELSAKKDFDPHREFIEVHIQPLAQARYEGNYGRKITETTTSRAA